MEAADGAELSAADRAERARAGLDAATLDPGAGGRAPAAPAVVPAPEHGAAPRPASGAPGSPPVPDSTQRAARLEERGFHVPPRRESERSATRGTEPAGAAQAATPASAPPPAQPGVVRSHTAELDDILKRIDAVLSESAPPQAVATLPGAAEQTVVQPPPTETINRPEAGSPPRSA